MFNRTPRFVVRSTLSPTIIGWMAAAGIILLLVASPGYALDPAYLADWPTVERVLADNQGENREDTMARQMAALHQLDRAVEDMADDRRWQNLTKDEIALRGQLRQAAGRIREEAHGTLSNELGPGFHWPFEEAPLQAWYGRQWKYESDPEFRRATLSRYLSPGLLNELNARKSASDARGQAAGRELLRGIGHRESTWDAMSAVERDAMTTLGVLLVLVLLLMLVREMRRFGSLRGDPMKLRAGFRRYELSFSSGIVDDYQSNTGGYHEGFKLFDGLGWLSVGVSGAYVNIPNGRLATTVTAKRPRSKDGDYVLFFDHTAQETRPARSVLQGMFAPRRWLLLPILGLAFLTGGVSDSVPATTPFYRGLLLTLVVWGLATMFLGWVGKRRVRRFLKRDAPRIMEAAAKEAAAYEHLRAPATATDAGEAKASADDIKAAANEVLASLRPYVAAAHVGGRKLSGNVWTDPFIVGLFHSYCNAALRALTGARSPSRDSSLEVFYRVGGQFASDSDPARPANEDVDTDSDPTWKERFQSGAQAGKFVLACFAGDEEALQHPVIGTARQAKIALGGLAGNAPATRLHPHGAHAGTAQSVALYMFTQQLLALDAKLP